MPDSMVGFSEDFLDAEEVGALAVPVDMIDDRDLLPFVPVPLVSIDDKKCYDTDIEMYWSKRVLSECTLGSRS